MHTWGHLSRVPHHQLASPRIAGEWQDPEPLLFLGERPSGREDAITATSATKSTVSFSETSHRVHNPVREVAQYSLLLFFFPDLYGLPWGEKGSHRRSASWLGMNQNLTETGHRVSLLLMGLGEKDH